MNVNTTNATPAYDGPLIDLVKQADPVPDEPWEAAFPSPEPKDEERKPLPRTPGQSASASLGGWSMHYTVDQRLLTYHGPDLVAMWDLPNEIRKALASEIERLLDLDSDQRKDAWKARWHSKFGLSTQALYHNVDLSPEAGYEVVVRDGEQTLVPRTDVDGDERRQTENLDEAQVVSSEALDQEGLAWRDGDGQYRTDVVWHRPILDIDFPVHVYPSTTAGHNHLYLDRAIPWEKYEALLKALGDAEILEPGYVSASLARKHTAVRLPWVKKES